MLDLPRCRKPHEYQRVDSGAYGSILSLDTKTGNSEKVRPSELKVQLEQWHALAATELEQVQPTYRLTSGAKEYLYEQEDQTLLNLRAY